MKFFGNLAFSSSSALQYFMTCVCCFQKFKVSFSHPYVSCERRIVLVLYEPGIPHGSVVAVHLLLVYC
jgi:hypothetical protein